MIKCTPTSHSDYDSLMKTLKLAQDFLENVEKRDDKVNVSITQGLRGKLRQRFYRIENSFNVQVKKTKVQILRQKSSTLGDCQKGRNITIKLIT